MIISSQFKLRPVILCGGSGTRLWPISTPEIPKQFISLGEKGTLLEETIRRINLVMEACQKEGYEIYDPLLVMHRSHTLPSVLSIHEPNVVYEDYANDTAVAIAKAVNEIKCRHGDDNVIMVVLPADHYIENVVAFVCDITQGIRNVTEDNIVLYGIDPISPETKYGYIIPSLDRRVNGAFNVLRFREKPTREMAIELINQNALWNSGIFTSTVKVVDNCLRNSRYNIMDWIDNPRDGKAPSFDVAVLQEYSKIYAQYCLNWKWSDVGSFISFTAIPEVQSELNDSSVITADCSNISVLNRNNNNIVVIGCSDLFIVANHSDLLIMSSKADYDNRLKEIATQLGKRSERSPT